MTASGHDGSADRLDEPVAALLEAIERALPGWLERSVVDTAVRLTGGCTVELRDRAAAMARAEAPVVLARVRDLLIADVDAQRGNPLSVLRGAVAQPTALLRDAGVPTPTRDEFDERVFPDDAYGLGPATWADVDESLREPGIVWGAWKAATVLRRRRTDGLR